ncbi:hypothetical protein U9M48_012052 [Paspalum notatum var. saurae]|uniref:Reverse transcriptase Ty1/copia-type domain-containing protein n=1 Tax=Paspalum notatum var. saurae TaxID=547442 RepID=A0AAQ3SWV1_PASNO
MKRDEAGAIIKHKARLVARGFVQQEAIDFDDAFAPVMRLLLALAAQEGWHVHHMDVKSAFLNGDLKEEVYVHQPPGFEIPGKEGKVLRLRKALYGLRQAPRAWNAKLDSTLKGMGFEQSPHEAAIYQRGNGGNALLHDLVITGVKDAEVAAFKEEMKATFQMSDLGPLSFYLGIEVHQDDSGITLRQTAYANRIVELAGLTDCNLALTPMEERLKLSRDSTAEEADATQYRRLVGSLRYLVHTRPDLAFSVGYVSRFMQRPMAEHQQAVKRIIRYVAGTLDHGLCYPRCPGEAHLVGYSDSDSDHGGDIDTSKSTSGILFFLGKCLVSWQSVKQQVVALSSCEAEYIAASTASTQALWLARLLGDLLGRDTEVVELRVDSKSALALAKNPVFHERSKHIRVRYHFIRDCWEEGSIKARYINTKDQLADLLTKPLGRIKFLELRSRTGMVKKKLVNLGHAQSEETRVKISEGVRRGWSLRLQRLMVQDGCFVEWRDMVADAARKGFAGGVALQWNSYKILSEQMQQEWLENLQKKRSMPRPRGNRRAPKTPEQRRKIAEAIAAKWLDQEYRERVCSGIASYHGSSTGIKMPRKPRPAGETSVKRETMKKKPMQARAVSLDDAHGKGATVKRKKCAAPYKDPMVGEKLEMISKIRAQRAALEIEKKEAIRRARSLIAEAEKAADALETAAATSPFAQASLIEARKLVTEARLSLECVDDEGPPENASDDTLDESDLLDLQDHRLEIQNESNVLKQEDKPVNGMKFPSSNANGIDFHFDVSAFNETKQLYQRIENSMERAFLLPSASSKFKDVNGDFGIIDFQVRQSMVNDMAKHDHIAAEATENCPPGTLEEDAPRSVEKAGKGEDYPSGTLEDDRDLSEQKPKMKWVRGRLVKLENEFRDPEI